MDILPRLIEALSKEEVRFYKLYAQRYQTEEPRKDLLLFDLLRQKLDDESILTRVYPDGDRNAFYRLKNRLMTDLFKSLVLEYFFVKDTLLPVNYYALAKLFFTKNEYQLAHYLLKKAEKAALASEDFEALDLIYSLFIKLSHDIVNINPVTFIKKRQENAQQLRMLREIDDTLAAVDYRLKITQNYDATQNSNIELLQKTVNEFSQNLELQKSARLRIKLYSAISKILLQNHDFPTLEAYIKDQYQLFEAEQVFRENTHEEKLKMLNFLINSLFKNEKYEESLYYNEIFGREIENYNRIHYDKYIFFYYNSLVINYSRLDSKKAIEILENLKESNTLKHHPFYLNFIYLNLAVLWFDNGNYKKSIKELTQLYIHESYHDMATDLKFKIAVAELIIRFEAQEDDVFMRRYEQIRREFAGSIAISSREHKFLNLLFYLARSQYEKQKPADLKAHIEEFMNTTEASDSEIIFYNDWLENVLANL